MISEEKKKIIVRNYFSIDCDVDTTIREAYELGFDRGIQKAAPVVRRDALKQVLEIIDEDIGEHIYRDAFKSREDLTKLYNRVRSHIEGLKVGEQK